MYSATFASFPCKADCSPSARSKMFRSIIPEEDGKGEFRQRRLVGAMVVYKIRHFFFSFFRVSRAARVACSKTSRTPSFVLAEHSRYFWAPIFLRTSSAWVRGRVSKMRHLCRDDSLGG